MYEEEKRKLLTDIAKSSVDKPSLTVDFWTGCDMRSFMGCTIHFIHEDMLKSHMLFFIEVPPPHSSHNVKVHFEDQLDIYSLSCFIVVTDNAANMKRAFEMVNQNDEDGCVDVENNEDDEGMY